MGRRVPGVIPAQAVARRCVTEPDATAERSGAIGRVRDGWAAEQRDHSAARCRVEGGAEAMFAVPIVAQPVALTIAEVG